MSTGSVAVPMIQHEFTLTSDDTIQAVAVPGASIGDHVLFTGREALAGAITCYIAASNVVTILTDSNENGHVCTLLVIKKF